MYAKCFLFCTFLLFSSCTSLLKKSNRLSVEEKPLLSSLGLQYLSSIYEIDLPNSQKNEPWIFRGRDARGPAQQSVQAPQFLDAQTVLVSTIGQGVSLRDLKTSSVLWKHDFEIGAASKAAFDENFVYVADLSGQVHKIQRADGKILWTQKISAESLGALTQSHSRIYIPGADHSLWALDAKTGKTLWVYKRPSPDALVYWSLRGQGEPLVSQDGSRIYLGFGDAYFVALNTQSGATLWEKDFQRPGRFQDVDVAVRSSKDGTTLYVPVVNGDLVALDASSGAVRWTQPNASTAGVFVDEKDGSIIYATEDRQIRKVSASGKAVLWITDLKEKGLASEAVSIGEHHVAVSTTNFGLLVLSKKTGKVLWEEYLGSGIVTPPAYRAKRLLLLTGRNYLYNYHVEI